MSVDPNLPSSDELASRASDATTGVEVSTSVQPIRKSVFREYAEAIVVAMLLAFAIRVFVVQAFKIPSGSMIPTLLIGDHILVSKLAWAERLQIPSGLSSGELLRLSCTH
jgi:signal peptidase I